MPRKHLLGLADLPRTEINQYLDTAEAMLEVLSRPIKKTPALRGKSVCTLFFEPSTRTRASFEMAAKTLSADTSSLTMATSSVSKGETLKDTLLTMAAMGAGCFRDSPPKFGRARLGRFLLVASSATIFTSSTRAMGSTNTRRKDFWIC